MATLAFQGQRRTDLEELLTVIPAVRRADDTQEARLGDNAPFGVYFIDDAETDAALAVLEARAAAALTEVYGS